MIQDIDKNTLKSHSPPQRLLFSKKVDGPDPGVNEHRQGAREKGRIIFIFLFTPLGGQKQKISKISTPDNIFFLYLITIKLCTLKQLENIYQKLKLKFS